MKPEANTGLRQRHSNFEKDSQLTSQQLRRLSQTAAELLADSMFSNSSHEINEDNQASVTVTATPPPPPALQSRLSHFQQQRSHTSFDTYPPKKNGLYTLMQKKASSSSLRSLEQTTNTAAAAIPSIRHSPPLPSSTTTIMGRFYTKRSIGARRSFSESSADRQFHKKYTSSDSTDSTQEEDELMLCVTAAEKRKITRRSLSNGLQQSHKHKTQQNGGGNKLEHDVVAGGCTIFGTRGEHISYIVDIAIRVALVIIFSKLETHIAFKRVIHPEEMWMYKNPRTKDFVSPTSLILAVIFGPLCVTFINFLFTKDKKDLDAASWTWTLCLGLNGLATSLLKISVGRPRPDFFFRCFPDGVMHLIENATETDNMLDIFNCTGNFHDINEGRKSFPSGHSSFAFAAFGFITFYVGSKLHAFDRRGRGETWRLFIALMPLLLAALIAVSRTCDYHHHWEDVTVGGIIGLAVSYYVYRQYYPSIFSVNSHRPYSRYIHKLNTVVHDHHLPTRNRRRLQSYKRLPSEECGEATLLYKAHGDEGSLGNDTEKRPLIRD